MRAYVHLSCNIIIAYTAAQVFQKSNLLFLQRSNAVSECFTGIFCKRPL